MLGIVLAKSSYREADQLVSILTATRGKIRSIARGSKKSTSKNAAALEIGSLVNFGLAEGKDFSYLTSVYIEEYFSVMRRNIFHSQVALLVCGIYNRFVQEEELDQQTFVLLKHFLHKLDSEERISKDEVDAFFQEFLVLNGLLEPHIPLLKQKKLHGLIQSSFEQKIPNWANLSEFI